MIVENTWTELIFKTYILKSSICKQIGFITFSVFQDQEFSEKVNIAHIHRTKTLSRHITSCSEYKNLLDISIIMKVNLYIKKIQIAQSQNVYVSFIYSIIFILCTVRKSIRGNSDVL